MKIGDRTTITKSQGLGGPAIYTGKIFCITTNSIGGAVYWIEDSGQRVATGPNATIEKSKGV